MVFIIPAAFHYRGVSVHVDNQTVWESSASVSVSHRHPWFVPACSAIIPVCCCCQELGTAAAPPPCLQSCQQTAPARILKILLLDFSIPAWLPKLFLLKLQNPCQGLSAPSCEAGGACSTSSLVWGLSACRSLTCLILFIFRFFQAFISSWKAADYFRINYCCRRSKVGIHLFCSWSNYQIISKNAKITEAPDYSILLLV